VSGNRFLSFSGGENCHPPGAAFYMVGNIDEALAKAEKLKA